MLPVVLELLHLFVVLWSLTCEGGSACWLGAGALSQRHPQRVCAYYSRSLAVANSTNTCSRGMVSWVLHLAFSATLCVLPPL